MAYSPTALASFIQEDLDKMEGKLEPVKVNPLMRFGVKKVSPFELHVNPDDEFSMPGIGPNGSIVDNYCKIARSEDALGRPVYEEPIIVVKLRSEGYMMLNGHHRWAGAIRAGVTKVRIIIENP
ncbi:MAG: ParB N-terminal domain-containing protein [Blautia sp.]|nr:ParB N-terminal domain-containing protein [Blautia sp.]